MGGHGHPLHGHLGTRSAGAVYQAWHQMADALGRGGFGVVTGDAARPFADLFRSVLAPYTDALVALVRTDVRLRRDLEADVAVSLFVGATLGELLRRGAVDNEFSD